MMLNPAALYDFFPDQLDLRRIEFASALFLEAICDILVMKRDEEEGRSKFKSPPAGDHDGASEVASFTNRGTKISVLLLLPERLIRGYALAAPWLYGVPVSIAIGRFLKYSS